MWRVAVLVLGLAAICLADCGDGSSDGRTVVATTTQVADLVRQVGGDRGSVDGMLRPEADPHQYEPRPSAHRYGIAVVATRCMPTRSGPEGSAGATYAGALARGMSGGRVDCRL